MLEKTKLKIKIALIYSTIVLALISCGFKTSSRNIDVEIEYITLHNKVDSIQNRIHLLKAEAADQEADSLEEIMEKYKYELNSSMFDSLHIEIAEKTCINYFGLDELGDKEMDFLFIYNAYKNCINRMHCYHFHRFESMEEYYLYEERLAKVENKFRGYVDSIIEVSRKKNFPEVKNNEVYVFYHLTEIVLNQIIKEDKDFDDSSCAYHLKDSLFIKVFKDYIDVRYG